MIIRCPKCDFKSEIASESIPATATTATCPKCGTRFRFRDASPEPSVEDLPPPDAGTDRFVEQPQEAVETVRTPEADAKPDEVRMDGTPAGEAPATPEPMPEPKPAHREPEAGVPWEEPGRYGVLAALYQTVIQSLMQSPRFFTAVGRYGGPTLRPVIFFVLIGFLQTVFNLVWAHEALSGAIADPQIQQVLGASGMNKGLTLIMTPAILYLQLYFFAALFYLMLCLVQPEKVRFRTVLRVMAYSASTGIVCLVPAVGPVVSAVWYAVCAFIGVKYAMGLLWTKTALALFPLYVLSMAIQVNMLMQLGLM